MADLTKFNQLLQSNDYSILEYFSYNKYCSFVKVIHNLSGRIFFLSVSRKYHLAINQDLVNHFHLVREHTQSKEFTPQQLSDSYPMIQLSQETDQVIDNISDKLETNYKQPIVLQNTSIQEHLNQIKRLKYCFRMLEFKFVLQTDQHILHLTDANTIEVFKIENYPKTHMHCFYVTVSLEQLYAKLNVIHDLVAQVETELYNILDLNQEKHNQYLTTKHIEFFIQHNAQLLQNKRQLHNTFREICNVLQVVHQKEQTCSDKLKEIRRTASSSNNLYREADYTRQRDEWETHLREIHSTKLQLMDRLVKLDCKIKNMYLILDQLGFNLSLSFNELRSELYKMLI